MAATLKSAYLMLLLSKFDIEKRMSVKSLSRDMASNYDWLGRQAFMNAYHVVDKFHVVKNMIEQLQSVRIRYRQEELSKERLTKHNQQGCQKQELSNGDSVLQLLVRSRGLLFLMPQDWSDHQKQRAKLLFEHYPQIKSAYHLVLKLRRWLAPPKGKTTYTKTREKKRKELLELLKELNTSGIDELKNIAAQLKNNMAQILHYFIAKETNAKAEALNRNLQRFVNVNYGARNTDFFLFRLKIYFT